MGVKEGFTCDNEYLDGQMSLPPGHDGPTQGPKQGDELRPRGMGDHDVVEQQHRFVGPFFHLAGIQPTHQVSTQHPIFRCQSRYSAGRLEVGQGILHILETEVE